MTRAPEDAAPLLRRLAELGATALSLPAVQIAPPEDCAPLDAALQALESYDWIVFASRHAVIAVFERMSQTGLEAKLPPGPRVATVGEATARSLRERCGSESLVSPVPTADGLAAVLLAEGMNGKRVLIPVSDLSRATLPARLSASGAAVDTVTAYRTVPPIHTDTQVLEQLRAGQVEVVTFASPSAVHNVVEILGEDPAPLQVARLVCIGPTTADALRAVGLVPAAVARLPTIDGLLDAILNACSFLSGTPDP